MYPRSVLTRKFQSALGLVIRPMDTAIMAIRATDMAITRTDTIDLIGTTAITTGAPTTTGTATTATIGTIITIIATN